jgi:3-hydroxy-9,10-secoandrosta-1,3,5(10)-triene-9,17-dione monooxygenase
MDMTTAPVQAGPPLTSELVLERVSALRSSIRERAAAADEQRTIPRESAQDFLDAGVARILTPRRFGGSELGLRTWIDAVLEISAADAAHGWCASLLAHHPHYLAQFPEAAQAAVWADGPDVPIAATLTPGSQIEPAAGGYRISGRISYLSGVNHCTWIIVGGMLPGPGGQPDWTLFTVPPGHYEVVDTWNTVGMRGTGSNTVVYKDVFVPHDHVLRVADMRDGTAPGGALHQGTFYRAPWITYAPLTFVAPMLGAARGALESYRAWTAERASLFGSPVAQYTSIQTRLARAAADLDAAGLLIDRAVDVAESADPAAPALRARSYRDACRASELIVSAMDTVMTISGSAGFAADNTIQRAWRDVHFAASHVILNPEVSFAAWGRQQFGLERDPQQQMY